MLFSITASASADVNKANRAELESITGLGPAAVSMILDERKKGLFKGWGDLVGRVKGIGGGNAVRLSAEGLTVDGIPYEGARVKADAKAKKTAADVRSNAMNEAASANMK
jgi:competence protein ComEA